MGQVIEMLREWNETKIKARDKRIKELEKELRACNKDRVDALNRATSAEIACGKAQQERDALAVALEPFREVVAEFGRKIGGGMGILSYEHHAKAAGRFWCDKMLPLLNKYFPGWQCQKAPPVDTRRILAARDREQQHKGAVDALTRLEEIIRQTSNTFANSNTANDWYSLDTAISEVLDRVAETARDMRWQMERGEVKP